jgi:CRP-like cAMP-binding protein
MMTKNIDFDICKRCGIKSMAAKMLDDNELEQLSNSCAEVEFKKGDNIIKQGALSSNVIYVKSGLVKFHLYGPIKEQIIRIDRAPIFIGLPISFNDKINYYSATALEQTRVCFIDIRIFKHFVHQNGDFAFQIIVDLSKNEHSSMNKCINRTQKNINGRIADALLHFHELYDKKEFILPLSRQELGNYTDTSRENVSRILTQLHQDKIIRVSNKKIKIVNEEMLTLISKNG